MSLNELETYFSEFVAQWKSLEKFDITLQEPALLWNRIYSALISLLRAKSMDNPEWGMASQWLTNFILQNSMHSLQPGDMHLIWNFIKVFKFQLKD